MFLRADASPPANTVDASVEAEGTRLKTNAPPAGAAEARRCRRASALRVRGPDGSTGEEGRGDRKHLREP